MSKKVAEWENRHVEPLDAYQSLLAKAAKKGKLDTEEQQFMAEIDDKLKSGELKLIRPWEPGYEEFVAQNLRRQDPNVILDFYRNENIPQWMKKYLSRRDEWLAENKGRDEFDYRSAMAISFDWQEVRGCDGLSVAWPDEKAKTFFLLKYS